MYKEMNEDLAVTMCDLFDEMEQLRKKIGSVEVKPILTKTECAELLGVHINTIYNWVKQGIITEYKLGNKPYYSREEILDTLLNK